MADSAMEYLGLNAKDFNREAQKAAEYAKYLENEATKLDAAIRVLDKTFAKAGKTTGAQTAQLNQMRKALREIQNDYKKATADADAFNAASGKGAGGATGRGFSINGLAAGAAAAVYGLSRAIQNLGTSATEAIEKYQAGGSRADSSSGDRGMNALGLGLRPIIQDSIASFPSRMAAIASKMIGGIRGALPFGNKGKSDFETGLDSIAADGEKELQVREEIAKSEDQMSETLKSRGVDMEYQVGILHQELDLERQKLELANLETQQGRIQANQAKEKIGALDLQLQNLYHQQEVMEKAATAETTQMDLKQRGMKNISEMIKVEADFNAKISAAQRQGLTGVVSQLRQQKGMALRSLGVDEKNLTTGQILDERSAGRKFARDARQQAAREADIQDRARRGAYNQTRGSRADRFGQLQIGRRANAAPDMTVNEIKTAKITAENFLITP